MKCPYCRIVIRFNTEFINSREVDFADCYKEACPLYVPERHFKGRIIVGEYCKKADQKEE